MNVAVDLVTHVAFLCHVFPRIMVDKLLLLLVPNLSSYMYFTIFFCHVLQHKSLVIQVLVFIACQYKLRTLCTFTLCARCVLTLCAR